MNKENVYYVYLHRRLSDNKVFYVGKGKKDRAWDTRKRNVYWKRTYEKHGLIVEIVFDNLDENTAFLCEKDTILEMRCFEYPLCNMTDGGEGMSGNVQSQETKDKRSKSMAGRKLSEEHKIKIGINSRKRVHHLTERVRDHNTHVFLNISGEFFKGTREDFCRKYSIKASSIRALFLTDNPAKTAKCWGLVLEHEDLDSALTRITTIQVRKGKFKPVADEMRSDKNLYTFISKFGEILYCSRYEFEVTNGFSPNPLFSSRKLHSIHKWGVCHKDETIEAATHRIKIGKNNRVRVKTVGDKVFTFEHISGEVFTGTRDQLILKYELGDKAYCLLSKLFSNKPAKSVLSWKLIKETDGRN